MAPVNLQCARVLALVLCSSPVNADFNTIFNHVHSFRQDVCSFPAAVIPLLIIYMWTIDVFSVKESGPWTPSGT